MRPTRRRRAAALAVSLPLTLIVSWLVASPVAATDVGDDAALRAAWADPAETLIVLTADITLGCVPGQPLRDSATNIVIEGGGHTLTQPCAGHDALHQDGTGTTTVRNLVVAGNALAADGLDASGALIVEGSNVSGFGQSGVESDSSSVTVSGSTISGNGGPGVTAGAAVAVTGSVISNNTADGITTANGSSATVTDSTVSGNGEAGIEPSGDATVTRSTVAGNGFGTTLGGEVGPAGLFGSSGVNAASVTLTNSTVVGNSFAGAAASVDIEATHSTISDNFINLMNPSLLTIHLFGSVVIDAEVANCEGTVTDEGHNFVDDDTCGSITPNSADPMLGALGSNGGPTQTRLPATGSPLIDAVPAAACAPVTGDQRGVSRPQGPSCDVGSVEVAAVVGGSPTPAPTATPTTRLLPDTSDVGSAGTSAGAAAGILAVVAAVLLASSTLVLVRVRRRRLR